MHIASPEHLHYAVAVKALVIPLHHTHAAFTEFFQNLVV